MSEGPEARTGVGTKPGYDYDEPNAFLEFLRQPRIVLLLMGGWSLLSVLSEIFTSNGLVTDNHNRKVDGLLGGFAMGWEGIALAAVYFYCSRDPKRHRAVFWLALVQTVAMAVSQVYHLFITADFTIESVLIPLAGSLFLAFLVCANVFQPRPEENTPVERVE